MKEDRYNLDRFLTAQEHTYDVALKELKDGYKQSHWMWFIFPQLKHLGRSSFSTFYGISGRDEALAFLLHPILSHRLREVSETILQLPVSDATMIFGGIDSRKLLSSMTLFDIVSPGDVFTRVIDKFFQGKRDRRTIKLVEKKIFRSNDYALLHHNIRTYN